MKQSAITLTALCVCAIAWGQIKSGLQVGEPVPSFDIMSVCGPDKGKLAAVR